MNNIALTVAVPAFNEAATITDSLDRILRLAGDRWQVVVCDDGSTDGTGEAISRFGTDRFDFVEHRINSGKTAAVHSALQIAEGEFFIVQDADLEYDPADIASLLKVARAQGGAVYGRRPSHWNMPSRWPFVLGVLVVDVALWVVYRRFVRDHATCYKLVPTSVMRGLNLQSTGFEGCVEITAKLMRSGVPIHQVPIFYTPRSAKEGKKLTWRYGWVALKAAWRWRKWVECGGLSAECGERRG